jgi:ribosome maturation factor RimP
MPGRAEAKAGKPRGGAVRRAAAGARAPHRAAPAVRTVAAAAPGRNPLPAIQAAVGGLHFELVDVERAGRGLLRVTIDRLPGQVYAQPGDAVTVADCEALTRQLQYALEVEGVDYARLEVSSPGLDRPLRREADYERFCGQAVSLTLKEPLAGRKHFQGPLGRREGGGWQLTFGEPGTEQVLSFELAEVREARLVPVVDFKARRRAAEPAAASGENEE